LYQPYTPGCRCTIVLIAEVIAAVYLRGNLPWKEWGIFVHQSLNKIILPIVPI